MMRLKSPTRFLVLILTFFLTTAGAFGAPRSKQSKNRKTISPASRSVQRIRAKATKSARTLVAKRTTRSRSKVTVVSFARRGKGARRKTAGRSFVAGGPWSAPTFADSTSGDVVEGEDPMVRRAAVEALGPYNGSVVVADPQTGRVLSIVNQKLAFSSGFQPCSTIKIVAALAGLSERLIDRDSNMRLYGRTSMNLTNALAHSNNMYFASIGVRLGYDKVAYYARLFGLGEKAGLNIEAEQLGTIPDAPPQNGGMGMMTSFGEGIKLTPLQLAALLSSIANGGTLYYLQYPRTQTEIQQFTPRIKRQLGIQEVLPELKPGMQGAVEFGTARRAGYEASEPIFGKTGTCTDRATPTHLGWFGSFMEVGNRKLVVVVLLTGGRPVNGPVASGIAGSVYRNLNQQQFFSSERFVSPVALIKSGF